MKADVLEKMGGKDISSDVLAKHFRQRFAEGYFYDYHNFPQRFEEYEEKYGKEDGHKARALDHIEKFEAWTPWARPFNFRNGKEVDSYSYRHLARQHKMVDIAFKYFYNGKDPQYIDYFNKQKHSLNAALEKGAYEVFRSGYRILNWLRIHNMFLGEMVYSDEEQLNTIATLLQHASHLYERNTNFRSGNHQTRGMSALAMLSILFNDFEDADLWYDRAMKRLAEHLDKEINKDGFQFERSVHYHMSDIGNYFFVFQLAKNSGTELSEKWENQLRSLFVTLAKIAYPDGTAPVLQDDTEIPWAERNEISQIMTLGYLLFEDPLLGYFASETVPHNFYWFLKKDQLDLLNDIDEKKPEFGSLHFPQTGYYIMRKGWNKKDPMMIISAGLDSLKPDHQHGDMLGIQAYAYEYVMLPNYQVRYSLSDFEYFKNSLVKNVALVDTDLQGKIWKSNKGGSGFGKYKKLPLPKTLVWETLDDIEVYVGLHDGFEEIGVDYSRQILYIKDGFWIVKDEFESDIKHDYKQLWQGHYTDEEGPELIRATFPNAAGLDIIQLQEVDTIETKGRRGKECSVISKKAVEDHQFLTILYPYQGYLNRYDENAIELKLKSWKHFEEYQGFTGTNFQMLNKDDNYLLFGVEKGNLNNVSFECSIACDLFISVENGKLRIMSLDDDRFELKAIINSKEKGNSVLEEIAQFLDPGESVYFTLIK